MALARNYGCLLLDKLKNPKRFKKIKKLPPYYRSHSSCWMDNVLFKNWLRDSSKKFQNKKRKVVLIIDSSPPPAPNPITDNLSLVK